MARIKVAQEFRASPNGAVVEVFQVGQEYDVPDQIAAWAERKGYLVGSGPAEKAPPKNKNLGRAPKNKGADAA